MFDPLADLNEPQRQAVTHVNGPLLVLAGAGSGKTRVITRRVAHLVQQGVAPWNVLAITFTNKAAGEMRERIAQMGVPRGAALCTFHSLCVRLLREFAVDAGLKPNFSIYDRADQIRLVKDAMAKLDLPTDKLPPGAVHSAISSAKNDLVTAEQFSLKAGDFFAKQVAKVFTQYQQLLATHNALDFDDLLLKVAFLMRDRPDILAMLGDRYRYVLIDEYQDTNRAQYIIAHGIAAAHENICATGDPDQSIYAWRGADINNILEFEHDYPNAVVVRLEENYRSAEPILTAASHLIAHNKLRKEKTLWTRRQGGADVRIVICDDQHAEAREVARRIAAYRKQDRQYGDMAVFYRINSLSRVIEEALLSEAVSYRVARGVEFYNRKEIKDVLAYLRLMVNPADDLSCQRVINTPARGLGETTVKRLGAFGMVQGVSLLTACGRAEEAGLAKGAAAKALGFAGLMAAMVANPRPSVRAVIEDVVKRTGLGESLSGQDEDDRQALANVNELISTAAEFDQGSEGGTLEDYLFQVSLVSDADHFEGAGGAVTLMTLHAAKGLEFPIVFVIGCEQGLLPFQRGDDNPFAAMDSDQLEEERRLAFVGMTRAKDELVMTYARSRMIRGRTTSQSASQFLHEIGRQKVAVEDTGVAQSSPSRLPRTRATGGFYADIGDRQSIEALDEDTVHFPVEYDGLKVGSIVEHPKFGRGRVQSLHQSWPQTRAEVFFEASGPKTIVLAYCKMKILHGG